MLRNAESVSKVACAFAAHDNTTSTKTMGSRGVTIESKGRGGGAWRAGLAGMQVVCEKYENRMRKSSHEGGVAEP